MMYPLIGEVQTVTGLNLHMIPSHPHLDDVMFTLVTTYETVTTHTNR